MLPALVVIALLVGACLGTTSPTPTPAPRGPAATSPAATASEAAVETEPPVSEPPPTAEPSTPADTAEPPPTEEPTETATDSAPPGEPSPSGSSGPNPAAACSGSDENRDFYRNAASTLKWTVYCAVLPGGWFVDSGEYRTAAGGRLQIAYRGPGGVHFELKEGGFCTADDGCVPAGTDAGDAAFGDKTGALVALDDGGWAVVVDRGKAISWLAVGTGMDEAPFRAVADALAVVGP